MDPSNEDHRIALFEILSPGLTVATTRGECEAERPFRVGGRWQEDIALCHPDTQHRFEKTSDRRKYSQFLCAVRYFCSSLFVRYGRLDSNLSFID